MVIVAEGLKAPYRASNPDTLNHIAPDGQRPFPVMVRHRYEGTYPAVQVGAAMESGGASVTPAASLVPATFTYRAGPEEARDAVVALSTMSRRGGAKLPVDSRRVATPQQARCEPPARRSQPPARTRGQGPRP